MQRSASQGQPAASLRQRHELVSARSVFGQPSRVAKLAASLDERGVRERALKEALADHLPVFGLGDVDD